MANFRNWFSRRLNPDNFKRINDTFGYDTGDRLAGKELIVTVTNRTVGDVCTIVNPLIGELARPFCITDDLIIPISASNGISTFSCSGTTLLSRIRQADSAMYVAKQQRKNRFCFYRAKLRDSELDARQQGELPILS